MNIAALTISAGSYLVLVALLLGSFINLAADRLPRGESLIRPRSHCRACGRQLNAVDLIPVGGYLVRRGRCAGCGVAIGRASLAVEVACGVAMAVPLISLGLLGGAALGFLGVALVGAAAVTLGFVLPSRPGWLSDRTNAGGRPSR
jgi:prepilin signal peptidase PulO-like enzyme (type II secretory pathway)